VGRKATGEEEEKESRDGYRPEIYVDIILIPFDLL
jgi:hypothetical protein